MDEEVGSSPAPRRFALLCGILQPCGWLEGGNKLYMVKAPTYQVLKENISA
jgi:hypothetical protein